MFFNVGAGVKGREKEEKKEKSQGGSLRKNGESENTYFTFYTPGYTYYQGD